MVTIGYPYSKVPIRSL